MAEQTAVDWLINKHFGGVENCTPDFKKHIEQAKQMEKEQIQKAYSVGVSSILECTIAEQYYNKTYNVQ